MDLNADRGQGMAGEAGAGRTINIALVTSIMVNALRRRYDRELMEEILALTQPAEPGEAEKRVWARIEAELNESKAKGFVIPRSLGG